MTRLATPKAPQLQELPRRAVGLLAPFKRAVSQEMVQSTLQWLKGRRGAQTLGLLLRMDDDLADSSPQSQGWFDRVRDSSRRRTNVLRGAWEYAVDQGSKWRTSVSEYPSIHACTVHGTVPSLCKFLESDLFKKDRVVSAIMLNEPMRIPEYGQELVPYDRPRSSELEKQLQRVQESPEAYLHSLGVGDFKGLWQDVRGRDQCLCMMDSGADECLPALQGRIRAYALFDSHGNHKESIYATDHACHGTKTLALAVANIVRGADLDLAIKGEIRLGLAPEAKAVVINVLNGECRRESGTLDQFLGGLDWAVMNKDHPTLGGYRAVSISIEVHTAFVDQVNEVVNQTLDYMRACKLVPILAAGNRGPNSLPLGTRGVYIGSCDSFGKPWERNGRAHLLAPGVELACCQPDVPQLGHDLVGFHTGTSLSTAFVAGALMLLCEKTGQGEAACVNALLRTRKENKVIALDAAHDYLMKNKGPDEDLDDSLLQW